MTSTQNIGIVGAGAIGTALAHQLSYKPELSVNLWSIEKKAIQQIKELRINKKYFPKIKLSKYIKATDELLDLKDASIVFLAIPSVTVVKFLEEHARVFSPKAVFVNLAKGFGPQNQLITDSIMAAVPNPVVTLKGPSFARELINGQPTAFTLGATESSCFKSFDALFHQTCIYLDHSTDVRGVELASILKNIYAIVMGIVDANFDSPNLRSLMLTRAMNEMRHLLIRFGGQEKTMFNYCGFGDFTLTALNDMSRNRTLGLLIGKGFFTTNISDKVVLEGRIAVNVFVTQLLKDIDVQKEYPIMAELHRVFNEDYDVSGFVSQVLNGEKP